MNDEKRRAQGALEYLIIIAAVLAIASVVVMFMTGAFGSQKSQASLARCKQAASDCKSQQLITPNAACTSCNESCVDPISGEEVAENAVKLCKQGKPEKIGSVEDTNGGTSGAVCGDGTIEGDEECDGDNLNGETCETQGFDGGTLTCTEDCSGFDTSQCTTGTSCTEGETVSCSEVGYYDCGTASCVSGSWDTSDCGCIEAGMCDTNMNKYPDNQCVPEADFSESTAENYCMDEVDGDGDGLIDCEDNECSGLAGCS